MDLQEASWEQTDFRCETLPQTLKCFTLCLISFLNKGASLLNACKKRFSVPGDGFSDAQGSLRDLFI